MENVNSTKASSERRVIFTVTSAVRKLQIFLKVTTLLRDQLQNYKQEDQRLIKIYNYFHRCKEKIKLRECKVNTA